MSKLETPSLFSILPCTKGLHNIQKQVKLIKKLELGNKRQSSNKEMEGNIIVIKRPILAGFDGLCYKCGVELAGR